MEGGNHILHEGKISRLPILLALLLCTGILIAAFGWFSHDGSASDAKEDNEPESVASMVRYGGNRYQKLERDTLKPSAGEAIDDPEELKAKAEVLMREAHDAYEYASELEGKPKRASFEEDYQKFKRSTAAPQTSPEPPKRSESFEKARTSKTRVEIGGSGQRSAPDTDGKDGGSLLKTAAAAMGFTPSASKKDQEEERPARTLADYKTLENTDAYEMDANVRGLKTPWCLRQGSVIPAVLLSGINSDLPGMVSAQVTDDVLDSVNAARVLIPRGTRITGQYGAAPAYGQERLFIAFDRLLFPGGQSMLLGTMPGTAQDGYSGFDADVDTHLMKVVTSALLLSTVSAGASVAAGSHYDSNGNERYSSAFTSSASNSLSTALGRIIERNINLSPTLEVAPGYLFNVAVTRDIYFQKPWNGRKFPG